MAIQNPSYLLKSRHGEIIRNLAQPQNNVTPDVATLAKAIAQEMRQSEHTG